MRKLCFLLCLLACCVGILTLGDEQKKQNPTPLADGTVLGSDANNEKETVVVEVVRAKAATQLASLPQGAKTTNQSQSTAAPVMLSVYDDGQTVRISLEEYLVHVVAGEMPASYEDEALRAQAVAARSYVAWKMAAWGGSGCNRGVNADVCTDSSHCMAYTSTEEMKKNWGEDYQAHYDKIASAVNSTAGEVLMYNGSPIQALFHSASGGKTEDAQAVWGTAFPYLQSVSSSGEENSSQHTATQTMKTSDLVKKLNSAFDGAGLTTKNIENSFAVRTYTQSGRVDVVKVGKVTATGRAIRSALGLNSTNFTVKYSGDEAAITTIGYGHGVGMSQVGANAMAKDGKGYAEILLHYYNQVDIEKIDGAS